MMPRPIVAANWKMNGALSANAALLSRLLAMGAIRSDVETILFPPFVYIPQVAEQLSGSALRWGAQTVCASENGAYTGEISATMLRQDFQCRYVLVGHSERRLLFGEDDTQVALKFAQIKRHQMSPLLCLGESLTQREQGKTEQVVLSQLKTVLQLNDGINALKNSIIAYEPVWAIGTGLSASPEQAQAVHQSIRHFVAEQDPLLAESLPLLYGGSVKAANAAALFAMPDIDGGLVGGASLDADEFIEIIKCIP